MGGEWVGNKFKCREFPCNFSWKICQAFNRSGAAGAVALDISKGFGRVWHAGLLEILKSYGISGQIYGFISYFPSNRWLELVLDMKSL